MDTEVLQNQISITTGGRLRQAREKMGLSQQIVAKRLCLKVSTIHAIENDHDNLNISSIFLRGYIRSYARLLLFSEEEIVSMMDKQTLIKISKVAPIQSFSGKNHKKQDSLLTVFTWLILFIVIGITGAWWWQSNQDQQRDITDMFNKSSILLPKEKKVTFMPNSTDQLSSNYPIHRSDTVPLVTVPSDSEVIQITDSNIPVSKIINNSISQNTQNKSQINTENIDSNMLTMNFTGKCWLEIFDADGKKLFSGTQYTGGKLNLVGKVPYKLNIGAPAAVQIKYQGNPVDLSQFIRSNQVARLTLASR